MNPNTVTAGEFIAAMEKIWHIDTAPAPNGIILLASAEYDDQHNAHWLANKLRAKRIPTRGGYIREFPSGARVYITRAGDLVTPCGARRKSHAKV